MTTKVDNTAQRLEYRSSGAGGPQPAPGLNETVGAWLCIVVRKKLARTGVPLEQEEAVLPTANQRVQI